MSVLLGAGGGRLAFADLLTSRFRPLQWPVIELKKKTMNKLETNNEMNYRIFVEEKKERPSKLSLWINTENELYIEICPDDPEADFYEFQCTTLNYSDAIMLRDTVADLVDWMRELQNGKYVVEEESSTPRELDGSKPLKPNLKDLKPTEVHIMSANGEQLKIKQL